jgi:hypothetical protein
MFDLGPEDRISEWRHFRQSIQHLDRMDMMRKTVELWSKAPLVSHYLEPDNCVNWPSPWTLIVDNMYCDIGTALGIFYTLFLTERFDNRDLDVVIYKDSAGFRPAVTVCEKYALNIIYRDVVNITTLPSNINVYSRFTVDDLNAVDYL